MESRSIIVRGDLIMNDNLREEIILFNSKKINLLAIK